MPVKSRIVIEGKDARPSPETLLGRLAVTYFGHHGPLPLAEAMVEHRLFRNYRILIKPTKIYIKIVPADSFRMRSRKDG